MPQKSVPQIIRCTALVYDSKTRKERQCKNEMKIGSLCTSHAKKRDPQGEAETDVEYDSSFCQSVVGKDEITTSLQELTLSDVDNEDNEAHNSSSISIPWTPEKVRSLDKESTFGSLEPYENTLKKYIPKYLSPFVVRNVHTALSVGPKQDRWGHVYIFRCTPTWRVLEDEEMIVKIGRADNVQERKKYLKDWCGYYTFEELFAFPNDEPPKTIQHSKKAERLAHISLEERLYHAKDNGKCLCQKTHKELFRILKPELQKTANLVQHWVDILQKPDAVWPGITKGSAGKHSP